jgi:hypothetical protein
MGRDEMRNATLATKSLHTRRRTQTTLYARMEGAAVALAEAEGAEVGKRELGLFPPAPIGDLVKSPRPAEMLESITVKGDRDLTVTDLKLHHYLVSVAYDAFYRAAQKGREREVTHGDSSVPMADLAGYLGESGRRVHVLKSLKALRRTEVSYGLPGGRQYTNVPLLVGWHESDHVGQGEEVHYNLPHPIWRLLASQPRYGYLELGAVAAMTTKYGVRLYQTLALRMARTDWDPLAPDHVIELTPEQAALAIGYVETPLTVSRLTVALKRAVDDLGGIRRASNRADAVDEEDIETESDIKGVQAFKVEYLEPLRKRAKGAPVAAFRIQVTMRPKDLRNTRLGAIPADLSPFVGRPDLPDLRVNSHVWGRAARYAAEVAKRPMMPMQVARAWLVALDEALRGDVPSTEVFRRSYRGRGLRKAIRREGPDRAAWAWFTEELADPDLLVDQHTGGDSAAARDAERQAEIARRVRLRDYKHGDRQQRVSRIPKGLSNAEKQALHEERQAAASGERLSRLEAANVVEVDIAWECIRKNGEAGAVEGSVRAITEFPWAGSRSVEVRLSWRSGDDMATRAVGAFRVDHDRLEGLLAAYPSRFETYRALRDPNVADVVAVPLSQVERATVPAWREVALPAASPVALTVVDDGLDDDDANLSVYDGDVDDEVDDFACLSIVEEIDDVEIPF